MDTDRNSNSGSIRKFGHAVVDWVEYSGLALFHGKEVAWFAAGSVLGLVIGGGLLVTQNLSAAARPLLFWGVTIASGCVAALASTGWLRFKLRPRLWAWHVSVRFFAVFIFFAVISVNAENYNEMTIAFDAVKLATTFEQKTTIIETFFADGYANIKSAAFFQAWLSLWVIAALVKLLIVAVFPQDWREYRNFMWLILCGTSVAGYPLSGLLYVGLGSLEPPAMWLGIVRLLLPPLMLPLLGVATIGIISSLVAIVSGIFIYLLVSLPTGVIDYLIKRREQAQIRDQKKLWLADHLSRFHPWLRGDPVRTVPDDSKGSRFATSTEVAAAWAQHGMGFGYFNQWLLLLPTDKHVLVMASTRSGKGVTVIIPHLLRYWGSAFVLDPKGENARATGRRRATLNSKVHYLDPFGISGKPQSRFNPLARFTAQTMEASSKALAAALILEATRDHWTAAAQQLVAALILHVVTAPSFPAARKDLVTVRRLLLGAIKPTLQEMKSSPAADGLVADLAASFLNTPEREFGSIVSHAQRETEILDNPAIAACLSAAGTGDEVDFAEWHQNTMTVFLCLSAPKFPVFNRWLRLVLTSALDEMTDRLRPPQWPVCFMLDELATLGHLAAIENAVGLAAGYGIQLVTVFQDVAQMRDLYKGRWASFIGNAGVRALFNLDDYDTARYWSDFIGGHLIGTLTQSQDIYGITKGQSAGEAVRPLLTPDELMLRYASGKMLVLKQGLRPIEANRVAYWNDQSLNGLWDDPRHQG